MGVTRRIRRAVELCRMMRCPDTHAHVIPSRLYEVGPIMVTYFSMFLYMYVPTLNQITMSMSICRPVKCGVLAVHANRRWHNRLRDVHADRR